MNKFVAVVSFILIGACIQAITKSFITENIYIVSSVGGIWLAYIVILYNKKYGKKVVC